MNEGTKSLRRRYTEHHAGVFPWLQYLAGKILDVGAGPDKIPLPNVTSFDMDGGDVQGDANKLSEYFEPEEFDVIHASQVCEHLIDPTAVIWDWLKVVKPGGTIIVTVPDMVTYEGLKWPSPWNGDHKHTWSMIYKGSRAPSHIYIPTFLTQFSESADVLLARYVERNYDWHETEKDQTWVESEGTEVWNEFVLQKRARINVDKKSEKD